MTYIDTLLKNNPEFWWMASIFGTVLLTLVAGYVLGRILRTLEARAKNTVNPWDDAVFRALYRPVRLLVWVVGLTYAAQIGFRDYAETVYHYMQLTRQVSIIIALGWFGIRLMERIEINLIDYQHKGDLSIDQMTIRAVTRLLKVAIMITAGLIVLQTLGFSVTGVLALGGMGGVAVGFAAKDLLANFFGALMIYFDRPFDVGDWVRSPDREIEGTVEDIGWRLTVIRTFDKRPLYVPNSAFSNITVENPSRMTNRRIYETIGIRYDDIAVMDVITKEVETMLKGHEEIDTNQTLMVYFNAFNASSVDFFVYGFTKTTDWSTFHAIKHEVLLKISNIITTHGAEIAFPTRTLHMVNEKKQENEPPLDYSDVNDKTHTVNQPI